jgi:hypothetical protein
MGHGTLTDTQIRGVVEYKLNCIGIERIDPDAEKHLTRALIHGEWGSVFCQQQTLAQYKEGYNTLPVFAELQVRAIAQSHIMGPHELLVETLGDLVHPIIVQVLWFKKPLEPPLGFFQSLRRERNEARFALCAWDVSHKRLTFAEVPQKVAALRF